MTLRNGVRWTCIKASFTVTSLEPYIPRHIDADGERHLCVVCGDRSTGYHYSVLTCEGCKGFFRRSVQKSLTYICESNGACIVSDVKSRNNCQKCRFDRCVAKGMRLDCSDEKRKQRRLLIENNRQHKRQAAASRRLQQQHGAAPAVVVRPVNDYGLVRMWTASSVPHPAFNRQNNTPEASFVGANSGSPPTSTIYQPNVPVPYSRQLSMNRDLPDQTYWTRAGATPVVLPSAPQMALISTSRMQHSNDYPYSGRYMPNSLTNQYPHVGRSNVNVEDQIAIDGDGDGDGDGFHSVANDFNYDTYQMTLR